MEEAFKQLGFSIKEMEVYRVLLGATSLTAADIAKCVSESRTNTYMILNRLTDEAMVIADDTQPVRRYKAAAPKEILQQKVNAKQEEVRQLQKGLSGAIASLQSQYNLSQLKPGVVYLEGLNGLQILLEDMMHSSTEVLLIPHPESWTNPEAWKVMQAGVTKRARQGVATRAIYHEAAREFLEYERVAAQNYEVRFLGREQNPGEMAIYGNKCVFIAYEPSIINTILTNEVITQTMRNLFEELWSKAQP